jgi:DNA-binding HxlR family transcriptional regulator
MENEKTCLKSIQGVMNIFGNKWSFIILDDLHQGPKRFNQIRKDLGISTKALTDTLKHLEAHGIVNRNVIPTVPITVEYSLTNKGNSFDAVLDAMKGWGIHWL